VSLIFKPFKGFQEKDQTTDIKAALLRKKLVKRANLGHGSL
jgi:hypothetical protein